jgi:hypothetical protein
MKKSSFNDDELNKKFFILQYKYKILCEENNNLLEKNYNLEIENKKLKKKNNELISFLNNYGFKEELKCFEKNINIKNIKYFQKDSEEFYKKEIKLLLEKINELEKELLKKENNIFLNNSQENNNIVNHIYNVQPNNSNLNIINSNQNKIHRRANSHLSNENSIKSKDFQNNNQKFNNYLYSINNFNNNNNNNNSKIYYIINIEESNQTNKSADEKIEDSSNYNIFDKKNENFIIQFGKNKNKITSKCLCKKCKNFFIKNEKSNQINNGCYFNFNDINDNLCPNCNKKKK